MQKLFRYLEVNYLDVIHECDGRTDIIIANAVHRAAPHGLSLSADNDGPCGGQERRIAQTRKGGNCDALQLEAERVVLDFYYEAHNSERDGTGSCCCGGL